MNKNLLYAVLAAILFGLSTPFSKLLASEITPVLLAGVLYIGSGIGLFIIKMIRDTGWKSVLLTLSEWGLLLSATMFGGVLAPIALMIGLTQISGASASLLLNLEAVLTATIAWIFFKEHTDWRNILGMGFIVGGGVVLSLPEEGASSLNLFGVLAVIVACLGWSVDNNLTRKISSSDAVFIAAMKGLIAGSVTAGTAFYLDAKFPNMLNLTYAFILGFLGYGISLVLFILALRGLGTSRTGAYFSTAPFIGAMASLWLLNESTAPAFWIAFILMVLGVWLHLTETHDHMHTHLALEHLHHHEHDEHHDHEHDFIWDKRKSHTHYHSHNELKHQHAHFPDIHHRHKHLKN
jgi:drug/metabolite transporter (DMT)-like permease